LGNKAGGSFGGELTFRDQELFFVIGIKVSQKEGNHPGEQESKPGFYKTHSDWRPIARSREETLPLCIISFNLRNGIYHY
jgi:hypothetical protein